MSLSRLLTYQLLATSFQAWVYPELCASPPVPCIAADLLTRLWETQRYFSISLRSKCSLP